MAPFESRSLSKAGESDGRWTVLERQDSQQTGRITDPNSLRVHFQFVAIDRFTLRFFRLRPPKSGVQLLSRWVPDGKTDGGSWQTFRCSTYPQSPAKRIEVGRIDRSGSVQENPLPDTWITFRLNDRWPGTELSLISNLLPDVPPHRQNNRICIAPNVFPNL